jgi:hypothetical protein
VSGATVRLRGADYLAASPGIVGANAIRVDTLTDEQGRFRIYGIDSGSYLIEATDGQRAVLLRCTLRVNDTADLGSGTLLPFAAVSGVVDSLRSTAHVQVFGLERLVAVDTAGGFTIADLPQGIVDIRITSGDSSLVPVTVKGVRVKAGATTPVNVPSLAWRYVKRLVLNTAPGGADVAEDVTAFPLLLRPFEYGVRSAECRVDGHDIRFTKLDGTPLPHEIERWDSAASLAEVWVRMDTVYGNASSQIILMSWGASTGSATSSLSNGEAVFDSADGFAGVWHLGESGTGAAGEYHDATVNGSDGRGCGNPRTPSIIPGAVGYAQHFDSSYIEIPVSDRVQPPGDMTLQAWVRLDSLPLRRDFFLVDGFSDSWQAFFFRVFSSNNTVQFMWSNADTAVGDAISGKSLTAAAWFHLTAVKSGTTISIYIDGRDETNYRRPAIGTLNQSATSLVVGSFYRAGNCGGAIDEMQISRMARTPAWIRLAYENQRSGSTLIDKTN